MFKTSIRFIRYPAAVAVVVIMLLCIQNQCLGSAARWQDVAQMIGPDDAVAVFDPQGGLIYEKNADKPLIPASTLKLLTALCALEHLGEDYRFVTEFYVNAKDDLLIKGYGDPLLISEQVAGIGETLAGRIKQVRHLILDGTWFDPGIDIPGTGAQSLQPYDAPVGALCVNFNTVFVKRKNNTWTSAEPQTPLLPAAVKRLKQARADSGRLLLSSQNMENLFYAGQLFAHFLNEHGIEISGQIRAGRADRQAHRLIYRHRSPFVLTEIISGLMAYSNNFTANQILLAVGAEVCGPPATLQKAVQVLDSYAKNRLKISPGLVEGSGISRKNRISAKMFGPLLCAFAPYRHLLTEENGIFYKTGTLNGIQSRAGLIAHKKDLYGFAVLINTPGRLAEPVAAKIASTIRNMN